MTLYQPAEDSYLLQETLKKYLNNLINSYKNKEEEKSIKKENLQHKSLSITNIKNINILDMGSGSGIQALICRNLEFNNILTADINQESVKLLKTQGFNSVQSDLFSNIKNQKFDLIIFNPPYLPEDKREPEDSQLQTTAGKKGYEIIIHFLKQAKQYLTKEGIIFLLFSSLSKPDIILKKAKEIGYNYKLLNKQKLPFFEELFVYELRASLVR